MKKNLILLLIAIMIAPAAFSQMCVNDVWMTLRNKQVGKAKRLIDECILANPDNADVMLMKANVYLQRHEEEAAMLKKNPAYVKKDPNAIWIANESFLKSLELNPRVETKTGMLSPKQGQILCAGALYAEGQIFLQNKDYDKAFDYLNTAARNFKLDEKNPDLALNLGYIYMDLADIAKAKKDVELYKKMLQEGINAKTPFPYLYLSMYDVYKAEKDTVNAGKILNTAKRMVPKNQAGDIYGYELDYYAMINDIEKLNATCDSIIAKFGDSPAILVMIATYLNNSNQYEKAEEYINKGLAVEPNNFELVQQMGYRYFYEALKYQTLIDEATAAKEWTKITDLQKEEKEVLEKAHTWVEKAYNINKDDRQNNLMLRQLKVKLRLEIPEELEQKLSAE